MVSWSGLLNKAFSPWRADATVAQTPPETLTRVTGNLSRMGGPLAPSSMEASDAVSWYEKVTTIFRCVDLIATTQSSTPIVVKNQNGKGTIEDDPHLFRLLNVKPNDYEFADAFRYRMSAISLLDPNGLLIEIQRSAAGIPVALHIIPPGTWIPWREETRNGHYVNFVDTFRVQGAFGTSDLKPEDAIWIKAKPHPVDPYRQMTPLMASRLAAETDFFARLFNRNFLINDGRPGLLVAVKGQISEEDSQELKNRFSGGYTRAGQTTVIESEGLDIRDLASSPRDIQWEAAVAGSGSDIMLAFGTPESVLGNASGRTFNNADAEWSNFWELTMVPHCNALTAPMDKLTNDENDDVRLIHNYDEVPVLQLPKIENEKRSEERWRTGVITLNEHLREIGMDEVDEPYANVRFLHNNIIAGPMDVAKEVAELPVVGVPNMDLAALLGGGGEGAPEEGAWPEDDSGFSVTQMTSGYEDSEELEGEIVGTKELRNRSKELRLRALGMRSRLPKAPAYPRDNYEGVIEGICVSWSTRQGEIVASRLDHAKFREGTRFWEGETKAARRPVDPNYAVDIDKWASDLESAITRQTRGWIGGAIEAAIEDMEIGGASERLRELGIEQDIREFLGSTKNIKDGANNRIAGLVRAVAQARSRELFDKIASMDQEGASLAEIKDAVLDITSRRRAWHKQFATNTTTTALESAIHDTYSATGALYRKTWHTLGDDKVRDKHRSIEFRTVPANRSFPGGIRYPGDLNAPISMTANCRCFLTYSL